MVIESLWLQTRLLTPGPRVGECQTDQNLECSLLCGVQAWQTAISCRFGSPWHWHTGTNSIRCFGYLKTFQPECERCEWLRVLLLATRHGPDAIVVRYLNHGVG